MGKARLPKANGPIVWALAAVSSEGQADTLTHQRRWAEETAAARGWRLTRVIEGVATGRAGPRRIVRDLLADLRGLDEAARPAKVLMIRADRLGREMIQSQVVLRDILGLGVGVFTRDQGDLKLDSAMDKLISATQLAVAEHENSIRSDKMRAVQRRKREAGEPMGTAPYGLQRKNGKFVADRKRAPIVRKAFELRLQGKGYETIGRYLATIAPPQTFSNGKERVVHWTTWRTRLLLEQRHYVGPIVSEATFARAQRVAAVLTNHSSNPAKRSYDWPLAGSLKCYCGHTKIGMACGTPPWRYRYYACRARWNHNDKYRLDRAERLEEQFVDLLKRLRASPELVERYRKRADAPVGPQTLERSIKELKAKAAGIDKKRDLAWELHAAGKVRTEDLQERIDRLAAQRAEVQTQLTGLHEQLSIAKAVSQRRSDVAAMVKRAAAIFAKATVAEQNAIAKAVAVELGGLVVDPNGKLKINGR